jgi:hypothetical protein
MASTIYSLAPLTINSTTIAVEVTGFSPGIAEAASKHTGDLYPSLDLLSGAAPRVTFRTFAKDAYSLIGLGILQATTFDLYLAKYSSTTLTKSTGSDHYKLALTASCTAAVQITGLSVSQDGVWMADCEAALLSVDGVSHPITPATGSLPVLTAQPTRHTLGPCVINGSGIPGATGVSIALNQALEVRRSDGDLYPRVAAQFGGEPRITVEHGDPVGVLSALGLLGANATGNAVVYGRLYNATTGVSSSTNGLSFTVASGRIHPKDASAGQNQVATGALEIVGLSTSATHPIAVSVTASVPDAG